MPMVEKNVQKVRKMIGDSVCAVLGANHCALSFSNAESPENLKRKNKMCQKKRINSKVSEMMSSTLTRKIKKKNFNRIDAIDKRRQSSSIRLM